MAASNFYAVIAGVGPGTGRSLAMKFAAAYPTIYLLARNAGSYDPIVEEINSSGHKCNAIGIPTDVSESESVKSAFSQIKRANEGKYLAAAIYNAGSKFRQTPFEELTEEDFCEGFKIGGRGLFNFSQEILPLLLKSVDAKPLYPPTLLLTGATAALKGSAKFASLASGKFAMRATGQSLDREYGPHGVHVAHVIIDGVIDTPTARENDVAKKMNKEAPDAMMNPDAIADTYWFLHTQHRSAWTHELAIRPYCEPH